ncbi:hypothetical protein QQ020_05960 [Fulvivirgaceae bacterium BMA12]|uniref:Uncharacterized protein n=1 Tax=Agaribacillus aureus TaxID=3051825 RepID=A0ABT8L1L5_9BACT|nr:hypothetical protein [Fulvivirgaceae bacterium BMA12]
MRTYSYRGGSPVYSDRCYTDQIQPEPLEGLNIVSMTRHFHFPVRLMSEEKFTVYRFITEKNNNEFIADWEKVSVKIEIPGKSSTFKEVYKKDFSPGTWTFQPGGPVAASPLLFKAEGQPVKAFYTTNFLFPEGVLAHKTRLLLIISLFFNYSLLAYFWWYKRPHLSR